MEPKFAFSLDRESWSGDFATRDEAFRRGVERALQFGDLSPNTVFVGQRACGNPQADGHAETVIRSMARRAREAVGDAASGYLRVNEQQEADLDDALERAILEWLKKHELMPQFFRMQAVTEHPMPLVPQVKSGDSDEVGELGVSEYPL